jgi:tRNA A-37 threonylcarbamoyl transferase component Bud32
VLKQALEKLRVKVDWFSSPARIEREALGLRYLAELAPPGTITPLVFEDRAHHLLAMRAVPQPRENWKTMLLTGRLEQGHVEQFARLLGTIHRAAYERRTELSGVFAERSFFESLRLEPYFGYTSSQLPSASSFLHALIEETRAARHTLVHGDYSPKNVLVHDGRLVLLDHEVIHWGDPAFDLGFALAHLLSKAHHLPHLRAQFAHAAALFWRVYFDSLGALEWRPALEPRAVRQTLGCLLARVAGRSPLEYLNETERSAQQRAVLTLMQGPPRSIPELTKQFTASLPTYADDQARERDADS